MILDIFIIAIVLLAGFFGFRKGFVFTFIHTAGWIISVVLAFIATDTAKTFLMNNTDIFENMIPKYPVTQFMPQVLRGFLVSVTSTMVFSLFVFFISFLIIKFILSFFLFFLSRNERSGFSGIIDGLFGLLIGIAKGIVIVYILLAVMIPVTEIFLPDQVPVLDSALSQSQLAKDLYDKNPLIFLLENTFR